MNQNVTDVNDLGDLLKLLKRKISEDINVATLAKFTHVIETRDNYQIISVKPFPLLKGQEEYNLRVYLPNVAVNLSIGDIVAVIYADRNFLESLDSKKFLQIKDDNIHSTSFGIAIPISQGGVSPSGDITPERITTAYNLVVNLNGSQFMQNRASWSSESSSLFPPYVTRQFLIDGVICHDVDIIKQYLIHMTGKNVLPIYNADDGKASFIILTSNKTMWKYQYDTTNGLVAFQVGNPPFPLDLEANPDEEATGTLSKLKMFGITYSISGGGGGTTDYSDLSNKPSVNGVVLQGNKTSSDLSLADSSTTIMGTGILQGGGSLAQNRTISHKSGGAVSKPSDLYKFSTDAYSHVGTVTAVTKQDIVNYGIQETISDLGTIRSGAALGATAVQPATLNNYAPILNPELQATSTGIKLKDSNGNAKWILTPEGETHYGSTNMDTIIADIIDGSYVTDKISGTYSGSNWTSIKIGSVTKDIPGGTTPHLYRHHLEIGGGGNPAGEFDIFTDTALLTFSACNSYIYQHGSVPGSADDDGEEIVPALLKAPSTTSIVMYTMNYGHYTTVTITSSNWSSKVEVTNSTIF